MVINPRTGIMSPAGKSFISTEKGMKSSFKESTGTRKKKAPQQFIVKYYQGQRVEIPI